MNIYEKLIENINNIKNEFLHSFINKIYSPSKLDLVISFSKGKGKSLIISLNTTYPFINVIDDKIIFSNTTFFLNNIKNKLLNSHFIDISTINNDNIVKMDFIKTTETYDKIHYSLIVELFKANPNIILLEEDKISFALRYRGIETKHPIIHGLSYLPPQKISEFKEFNKEEFILNYPKTLEDSYLKEKYNPILISLKRKHKSLVTKVKKLIEEKEKAKENLVYKDYGELILSYLDELNENPASSIDLIGIDITKYNLSPTDLSQKFFKIYKKAKTSLKMLDQYIDESQNEVNYIESILNCTSFYKEDDYLDLIDELKERKIVEFKIKNPANLKKNPAKPYYFLKNGVRIGFGKNAKQNNELTFKLARKNDYFVHIKDLHGSHVVIFDENPSDEIITFALELALYLSNKNDGELQYTKISNVKKSGTLGLVNLLNYESYTIRKITNNFNELFNEVNRF